VTTTDKPVVGRLEPARRRVVAARRTLAVGAGAAFVAAFLLVRASHLGAGDGSSAETPSAAEPATSTWDESDWSDDGWSDGGGAAISPGAGQPQVRTRVS
jgi:hypothetical protein